MIVPKYWSESVEKTHHDGHKYTIKRFGWSDISELKAKEHANCRLNEALKTLQASGSVRKQDHKVAYNGSEGIPIREEVIANHKDVVISRNSYGALCLNTPDVMFADIDLEYTGASKSSLVVFFAMLLVTVIASLIAQSWHIYLAGIAASIGMTAYIAHLAENKYTNGKQGLKQQALDRFKVFSEQHPNLHLRVYETTMGYRILFMEKTHDPSSEATEKLLKRLNTDSVYIRMCRHQHCFRARVSPKPWRIGVDRIRPRPGVWPIREEKKKDREKWVIKYNEMSEQYASCRFLMQLGSHSICEKTEHVRKLHDELCQAYDTRRQLA